jgi:hypothetical protein
LEVRAAEYNCSYKKDRSAVTVAFVGAMDRKIPVLGGHSLLYTGLQLMTDLNMNLKPFLKCSGSEKFTITITGFLNLVLRLII